VDIKDHCAKLQEVYENFCAGLYNIVLGQCTKTLEEQLKSHNDFPDASNDGITLLQMIKTIIYTFKEQCKLVDALANVKEKFYSFKQGKYMSLQTYHE
jgi:hypothetical protein